MSATALASNLHHHINDGQDRHDNDWDEEVVPALKKKLAKDSARLDQRMQDVNFESESMRQRSLSRPKPIPKRNQYDEIIQDGLGNDELIPSEWATGSRARFLPASRAQDRDEIHHQASSHYTAARSASESYTTYNNRAHPDASPTEHFDAGVLQQQQHQQNLLTNSPPAPDDEQAGITQARERARKLARQRQQLNEVRASPSDINRKQAGSSGEALQRTASTPLLRSNDAQSAAVATAKPVRANGIPSPTLRNVGSKTSLNDRYRSVTPSKIPLPVSGSMDKYAMNGSRIRTRSNTMTPQLATPEADSKDANEAQLGTPDGSPAPRARALSAAQTPNNKSKKSVTTRNAGHSGRKYGTLQNSPPTQDVLDQFGPLGGTPMSMRTADGVSEFGTPMSMRTADGVSEFGTPNRSVSNPWDEELLPTVKKRLAQQAMLERDPRFSTVDGLIDTWDRDGMPLSTRSITPRKENIRDVGKEVNDVGVKEGKSDEKGNIDPRTQLSPTDQQEQRMKRLTEQLDFGFQKSSQKGSSTSSNGRDGVAAQTAPANLSKSSRQRTTDENQTGFEMEPMSQQGRISNAVPAGQEANSRVNSHEPMSEVVQQAKRPSRNVASGAGQDDDGAGCCKCTIM